MIGGLTAKQAACLAFIRAYIRDHDGVSPSLEEIRLHLGLSGKGDVHRILVCLRERGFIDWTDHCARSIRLLAASDPYSRETLAALSADALEALRGLLTEIAYERSIDAVLRHPTAPAMERAG